ncbi:lipoprotein [Castellaniella ginsengisoli]|uniref:Lipoprotein n=2 Tax=Castellaniella ginsengisoli TaxID=546114 RepID=A0ABP3W8C3_9BURK
MFSCPRMRTLFRGALTTGAAFWLAGCAHIAATPPGTPLAQVTAQFGAPTLRCTDRQGRDRVVWSRQPMGQYAWGATVDAQGRVQGVESLLTDAHFQRLKQGVWTAEQVRCEFGPPAIIDTAGLPNVRQIVWSYRYKQDHTWNSLMYVFMGPDGRQVTKLHPGPDPMYEPRETLPRF